MSETTLEILIPLDEDGFIEMECDYCKNRFMLHKDTYESEDYINFFCPICGFANKTNTFFVPEVLEKAQQMALNYMYDYIDKTLGKSLKQMNKSSFLQMSLKTPIREIEKELYTPSTEYVMCKKKCCEIEVKVKNIDKETGTYCPICGGMNND